MQHFLENKLKTKDLSASGIDSLLNFSWTPSVFFQVPGTMHKKGHGLKKKLCIKKKLY